MDEAAKHLFAGQGGKPPRVANQCLDFDGIFVVQAIFVLYGKIAATL
jgi:hypothetical protein